MRIQISESLRWLLYLAISLSLLALSILFITWGISYMEKGLVATSLLSVLAGFTLLSASLYSLRLSAYVYAASKEERRA
ncbi:MAG: hypothetical protein N3F67_02550 [Acidilobaceae archaeon]|nr:hypothetical protein [Acidilobaceae archaeon]